MPATPFIPKGALALPSNFPATPADGDVYRIIQDVFDNDPAKTNTGDFFREGEHVYWATAETKWRTVMPRQYRVEDGNPAGSVDELWSSSYIAGLLTGILGTPGDSAYAIAVSNGFSGTEGEWLDSLAGADGTVPAYNFQNAGATGTGLVLSADGLNIPFRRLHPLSGITFDVQATYLGISAEVNADDFDTLNATVDGKMDISIYDADASGVVDDSQRLGGELPAYYLALANTTGTLANNKVAGLGSAALLEAPVSGNATSGQVVKGGDTRLSDARTPTTHAHAIAGVDGLQEALDAKAADTAIRICPTGAYTLQASDHGTEIEIDGDLTIPPGLPAKFSCIVYLNAAASKTIYYGVGTSRVGGSYYIFEAYGALSISHRGANAFWIKGDGY